MSKKVAAGHPVSGVDAGPGLDCLPPAPFHRHVLMLTGIGVFPDGCDIYLAPGVLVAGAGRRRPADGPDTSQQSLDEIASDAAGGARRTRVDGWFSAPAPARD